MPKFISQRDVSFFKGIARELVDTVVENTIVLFKINLNETRVNIYGESLNKTWYPGVQLFALIDKEPETSQYEGFGADTSQTLQVKFDRYMCEEKNVYPEIGDVLYYNESYYEISNVNEIQFIGGLPDNNFSIVVDSIMVSKTSLNIEHKIK